MKKLIDILIFCNSNNILGLYKTIDSIFLSTTKNFNVIVKLNDRSSQIKFKSKIKVKYKKEFINVIQLNDNSPEEAINQLLEAVNSKYVQILPAGDIVCPHYYDILTKHLSNNYDFISTPSILMKSKNIGTYQISSDFFSNLNNGRIFGHLSSFVFSKKVIGNNRFPTNLKVSTDIDFLIRISKNVKKTIFENKVCTIAEIPGNSANNFRGTLELFLIFFRNKKKIIAFKILFKNLVSIFLKKIIKIFK